MSEGDVARVCITHPDRPARLICTACARWHCDDCAKPLTERIGGPSSCPTCRGILKIGEVVRAPDTYSDLLRRVASTDGIVTIVALALPGLFMGLGGLFFLLAFVIWGGVLGGYFFRTVTHVARGDPGLPFSADVMFFGELLARAFHGLWIFALAVGPALVVAAALPEEVALTLAALVVGTAIAPASLLAAAVTEQALNLVWPLSWFEMVQRAPRSYVRLVGMLYATVAGWLALVWTVAWVLGGSSMFLVTPFIHTAFALWVATLFGRHLQIEAEAYGVFYR